MVININFRKIPVSKFQEDSLSITVDYLAIESVINLFFNGKKITSLLGSPNDAKFLLVGHLLSEGYLNNDQIMKINNSVIIKSGTNGIDACIDADLVMSIEPKTTGITTTSCGACNSEGLDELVNNLPIVSAKFEFNESILYSGMESMKSLQDGFQKTGGMHSAALLSNEGVISYFSEDIGRHNAVDKVIGKSLDSGVSSSHILLLSGRCGWDIVAKASRANIPVIASIGACSTLAADCARALGIKLYSFVKKSSHTIIG